MADGPSPFINKALWAIVRWACGAGSRAVGLALLLSPLGASANHYSGGSITYRCLGAGQYQITLDLFLDCAGVAIIPQSLNFHSDCGEDFAITGLTYTSSQEVSQLCAAALPQSTCNGGPYFGIEHYQFQTVVALAPCDDWTIWWYICCRSGSVDLTGSMGMYIEANVNTALAACDNSPVFADQSLPYVCVNQPVYYNFGVNEPDGDSIAYRFISARYFGGVPQPVMYNAGYSGGTPVPGITLDPVTGQIVFTPMSIGNYVIAIEVEQFDANGNSIGTVMRDIMFVVMACTGNVPTIQGNVSLTGPPGTATLTGPNSIDICDGSPFCFSLTFNDPDPATVLSVTSQAAALLPGSTTTITGANPAVVQVCWTADADHSPVNVLFQAADGSCPVENTASVSVNITSSVSNGPPNAGTNGAVTACPGTPPVDLFTALGGTPDADGHWLSPSNSAHSGQFIVGTDVAGVYTYVAGNACGSATATVTVTVSNGSANAGSNGTLSLCSNAPAQTLFDDLGGSPQAGGSWTGPGGAPHSAMYDPAIDAGGVYTYTVAGGGACPTASATVTVTEVAAPLAGSNGTLSICSNGAAVALFASLTGTPQAGGTWTGPGGAAHGPNYNPAVDGPGTYTYTVAGTAPCANATATVTVTENAMPNAGLDGLLSICSNGAATNLFPLLAGAQGGGSWTAPGGAPFSGTYDPTVDATGTYTYTVAGTAPCANDQAVVTVTESGPPNAGTDGTLTTCSNSGTSNLFLQLAGAQGGGTWTAPGGGAFSGTYDPAVHAAGVYTYTVAGVAPCGNDQATVTVSENVAPSAGADGIATTCGNGAAVNLFGQLVGAQAGGTWTAPGGGAFSGTYDPAVDAPGIYTYTVTGVAPCLNDQAVVTVTENAAPNAGADGILATCSNSGTTNLFTLLVGAQAGGTWTAPGGGAFSGTYDPAVDASGIYTYTLAGIAPCGNDQATVTVTEGLAPSAGVDGALTICSNGPAAGLLAQLAGAQAGGTWTAPGGGAFSGTYDPTVDVAGIYTYTVAGVAPCLSDQATVAVQEIGAPNAGANGTLTTCSNSSTNNLFGALVGAQGGGFWTAPGGGAFGGTYDPAVDGPGVYTYTVAGIAPCGNDQSTVTVTEIAAPDAGTDGSLTTCDISAPTNLFGTLAGAQAGGMWTAPGGGAFSGTYDPVVDVPGAYIYTVPGVAPCLNDQATVNVTENTAPNAGADGTLTTCSNGGTTNLFGQLAGAQGGGTWMAPGGGAFSGTYDPAMDAPGIYLYTIVGPVPCGSDQASVTVTENAAPNAGLDGILTVCSNGAAVGLFAELTGAPAGGTWTTPGGAAFSGTYDPAVDAPGLYTYTVAGTAPCASDQAVVTVQESQAPSAGSNGLLSICTSSAAAVLFTQLTGADLGGTWTDPNGDPFGGVYDPASDVPGAYTYTVAGPLPCGSDQAIVTVVETAGPFAGADVIFGICSANAPTNLFPQLPGAQPGGTWTGPLGGPFSGVYDPATDGSGAYTYTVAGSGPCAADQAVVNVVEGQAPHAGADAILDICSDSPAASLFPLLVGAQPGGTWTAPGGGAFGGTYDPAVNGSGVYTYSVPNAPPCLGDQATVTVTEHAAPNPGANATTTVCDQGAAIDLFDELPGADAGGTWTAPGGAAHSTMYDPVTDAPGTYTYTVAGVAPCGAAQSIVVVQETGAPSAGVDGSVTLCSTSGATDLFNALTGADAGGTWTAPGGAAHSNLLDPAVDAAGVYTYTIAAVAPCAGDQSQVTVAISAAPNAGADGATTVCDQGAAIDLFNELTGADAGGTWTAPGGAAHSNLYDPAVDSPGTYTYTVTGTAPCGAAQSAVVVQETGTPNAGTDGTVTLCSTSGAIDLFNALTGADPGGTWTAPGGAAHSNLLDPLVDAAGVYTYTIAAVAPCAGAQSQVTVAVNAAPDAGADGATTVCDQGAAIDLFNELTGADAGGTWTAPGGAAHSNLYDPLVDGPGTYTYTIAGTAPCGAAQSVVVVQETGTPNSGGDGTVTLCSTSGATDLFNALTGADAGGTWTAPGGAAHSNLLDPLVDAAGVYTYTIVAVAPCAGDQSQVTVAINAAPDAGTDGATTVCDQGAAIDLFNELTGADAGGSWAAPGGGAHSNLYDPLVDGPGTYTYTIAGIAPCGAAQSVVVVQETSTPNAGGDGTVTLCSTSGATDLFNALVGADAGGTWTAPGGAAHSNLLDPLVDAAGVYVYTIAAVAPCAGDQSQVTVAINAAPDAGTDGATTVCDQGAAIDLFNELTGADAGGTWTAPGGAAHSNLYDPAVDSPGTYTYTVAGTAPCGAAQSVVVVQETGTPNAGGDGMITLCSTDGPVDLFGELGGPDAGGTWTAPGGAVHSNLLDPAVDAAGVYTYTIVAVAPCAGDQSQVTVTINVAPDAGTDGATTVCDQGAAIDLFNELTGADAGGTWTAPGGAAHSNLYDPSVDGPGTYTYTIVGAAPCGAAQSVVVVQETSTPNAGIAGAITLCSAGIAVDLFGQLGGTPDVGGTWTAPGGAAHGSTLDPATDAAGTYTYTIVAAAPCVTASAIVAVSVDPAHDAGTNGTISVCTGDAPFALVDHLGGTPDAGGGWTGPGGAASSGTFDPATSAPGVYSYLLSGNSCPDALSSVTVAVLSGPNAGQDNSVAFCSSDATVDLIDQLLGAPGEGGTWTGPDGLSAGATFDPATSVAGTYTYTIPGNAACPAATADVNITVSEAVSAGTIGISTLCSTGPVVDLFEALNGSPDPGGTWTDPHQAPFDGTYDPATDEPGVYTYTVAAAAPCPTTSAGITIEVNTAPDAGTSTTAALCADNAPVGLSTLLGGTPDAGGTWTDPEGAPFDGLFDPATTAPGIYTYQVVGIVPCAADQATVTVGVAQPADAGGDGAVSLCSNAAPFALQSLLTGTPDPGGAWTAPDGTPSTPTLDPATAASGAYVYTVTPPAPCSQAIAVVQVDIITVPVVEPTFTMTTGCAPVEVTFASGYAGAGACHWDFGNDSTSVDCGPVTMLYTEPGTYAVTFTADPGNGCATVVTLGQQVNVYPPPTAAFGIVATGIHTQDPIAAFDNQSTGALSYLWRFGEVGTSTAEDPQFTFPYDVEATYPVCLIAYAAPTCADTLCQDLFVPAGSSVFTPNAFTPDGDGINDGFAPNTRALNAEEYHFYIFDRWGQPLYDTQDPNAHWDGRSRNGMEVPEGVYVWKLMTMDAVTGERFEDIGHVSLVR